MRGDKQMGKKRGEAQVHDPDSLRESIGNEGVEEERDYRAEAEEYGISNADNYSDAALANLVDIRKRISDAEQAREERIEAFRESLKGSVVEPEEASSAPGVAEVQEDDGESGEAQDSRGGEF